MMHYFIMHWGKTFSFLLDGTLLESQLLSTSQANTRQRVVLVRIRMFEKPHLWTNGDSAYLPEVGSFFRGQRVRWQQLSHPHSILTAALRVGQWWATAQTIGGLEPPSLFLMAYWAPKGLFCPSNIYFSLCIFFIFC